MNKTIDAIYRDQKIIGPKGEVLSPFPVGIHRNEGEALYQLIRKITPKETLEIGTAWGLSTLFICQALHDNGVGHHTALDPFQGHTYKYAGVHNVKKAGLSNLLTFHEESSHFRMPKFVDEKKRFDFIFIDGSHLFDAAFVDYFYADQLIPVGGLLMFDDLWMPAVRKVIQFAMTNRGYEVAEEFMGPPGSGLRRARQEFKHQLDAWLKPRKTKGAPTTARLLKGRKINWCVLRKTEEDTRKKDHFVAF